MVSKGSEVDVTSEEHRSDETAISREQVIQCYRTILKRDPENEEVIQTHLSDANSLWRLIERFIYSEEFKTRLGDSDATRHDVIQCYKRILKREPESESAIRHHLSHRATHWELVSRIVDSEEHRNYVVNISAMSLLKCIGRRYLANSFGDRDKYICFFHHYSYLAGAMSPSAFQTMLKGDLCLFDWSRENSVYTVTFQSNRELDNEGEVLLQFKSGSKAIYSLTFSIVPGHVLRVDEEQHVILVSRLQGKVGQFPEIRLATKQMGEVAPQAVLIAVLQGIALANDIRTVAGVAATNQLSFERSEDELLERAYDHFFQSVGATGPSDGFYFFEVPLPEKPIGPGHRGRKQWKREFKKEITNATLITWRDTISFDRSEADPAQVHDESEMPARALR
jgi:uncharacterized protein VirK/YbjX